MVVWMIFFNFIGYDSIAITKNKILHTVV